MNMNEAYTRVGMPCKVCLVLWDSTESTSGGERGEEETGYGAQGCRTVLDLRQDYRPAQRRGVWFMHSIHRLKYILK